MPHISHHFSSLQSLKYLIALVSLAFSSCYSFTGGSIPPEVSSVSIIPFLNQSTNPNTAISQTLTDRLKDKFLNETRLKLSDSGGDWVFKGFVTGYDVRGQAPTSAQVTALNRLTLSVKVEFTNSKNEKETWTQTFTQFEEYESSRTLTEVESELLSKIYDKLVVDIFNRAVVNW